MLGDIKLDGELVVLDGTLKLDNIDGKSTEYIKISEARMKRATIGVLTGDFGVARDELLCKARKLMLFNPKVEDKDKKTGVALSHIPDTDTLVINEGGSYAGGVKIESGASGLQVSGDMQVGGKLLVINQNMKLDLVALVFQLQQQVSDLKQQIADLQKH
jgi:hypothetical protein